MPFRAPSAAALGGALGLAAGPGVAALMLALGPPDGLSGEAWFTLALLALMVVWWVSEAIPVAATALLPLWALPSFGVASARDAAAPYADPIVFLFIGGFMLAAAVEKWGLHRRLALGVAGALGERPVALVGGFLLASGLVSMWISNTATTLILAPIALGVARVLSRDGDLDRVYGAGLVLAVAYGASIGGVGTPIGSPTNLVAMSYLERNGMALSFMQWMALATPLMAVMLLAAFAIVGGYVASRGARAQSGGGEIIRDSYRALGAMTQPELRVLAVFGLVAILWMTREAYSALPGLGGVTDTAIALCGATILFLAPSGDAARPGAPLLDWSTAERIPWGIALLFGAGLSMAEAMEATGVTQWLADNLTWLSAYPAVFVIAAIVLLTVFVSELASNVATLSAFLPIVGGVAAATGIDPLLLVFPACMGASLAFMLPIGTPPNAIAYATGMPSMRLMLGLGLMLNIVSVIAVSASSALLGPLILSR
jgi:sodium-dependent dicarboxylate transporter 2/3/5